VPKASNIAVLVNPNNLTEARQTDEMLNAARMIRRQLRYVHASARTDFEKAFAAVVEQRAEALIIGTDGLFSSQREPLVALTTRHAMPTIYNFRESGTAGGLISYGPSQTDAFRQAGVTPGVSSKARSQKTCQWCSRPNSSRIETSKPQDRKTHRTTYKLAVFPACRRGD
jgi:putative tryptophan/tyrosine transport system substrate-binding protein